jgi:predicted ATPase
VQALLIARIDRLEKEAKKTLQLASVIGRSFYERVLEIISETGLDLDDHLQKLEQMELIHEAARLPELEYAFSHALTRDAAYKSILRRHRRQFHRGVGEALELLFPNSLQEEAHRLAYHFYEARDFERALSYYTMAGDKASGLYANTEAIDHYGRALEIARNRGTDEQLIYLYSRRGRTYEVCGRYDEARANYQDLMALAQERGDITLLVEALLSEATLRSTYTDQYDPQQGRALLEQALELAQSSGNRQAEAKIYWNLMLQGTYSKEEPSKIVAYGEKAVAIARQYNLREELAYALHDLARPYTVVGRMQDAKSVLKESGKLWREQENLPMLADNRATLASGYAYQGSLDEAIELAQEAFTISRSIGNYWGQAYSLAILAPIFMERGQIDDALQGWQDAIPAAAQANFGGPQVFARINLSLAYGYLGDVKQGLAYAELALAKAIELEQTQIQFLPLLAQAMLHLHDGNVAAAKAILPEQITEADLIKADLKAYSLYVSTKSLVGLAEGTFEQTLALLNRAITVTESMGLVVGLLELWPLKGQVLIDLDRLDEAESVLNEAGSKALSIGSQKQLWQILGLMSELESARGNAAAARALRQEAQGCIEFIASHISQPDLRLTFLNSLPVLSINTS